MVPETSHTEAHFVNSTYSSPRCDFPSDTSRGSFASVPSATTSSSGADAELSSTQIPKLFFPTAEDVPPSSLPLCSPAEETLSWLLGTSYEGSSNVVTEWTVSPLRSPIDAGFKSPCLHVQKAVFVPDDIQSSQHVQPHLRNYSPTSGDHEISFLLRWFSEHAGSWMDIFDTGAYFTSYVPMKSQRSELLNYAAVACAAKTLARVQEYGLATGDTGWSETRNKMQQDMHSIDWQRRAAEHHNTALSLLLRALKEAAAKAVEGSGRSCTPYADKVRCSSDPDLSTERSFTDNSRPQFDTDEILTASAILCMYECLDSSIPEWLKHLNGAKCLLNLPHKHASPSRTSDLIPYGPLIGSSIASYPRRATFWNIVRQDVLAACK